ncbi:MAG: hypothetical protein ACKOI3_12480 [Actinomycetota bacterium]
MSFCESSAPKREKLRSSNSDENDAEETPQSDKDDLRIQLIEAQLRLFEVRDFAIGASARSGEMQARLTTKELELANALTTNHEKDIHIQNHAAHIARLEQALAEVEPKTRELVSRSAQLDRVYASTTWRLGRLLMLPVRILRRLLRRA